MKKKGLISIMDSLSDLLFSNKEENKLEIYSQYIEVVRKLAYMNYPLAMYELGQHYDDPNYFGYNPNVNKKRAFYWYLKACNAGVGEACNEVAIIYEVGIIVEKDVERAKIVYQQAINHGSVVAKENLKHMLKNEKKI